MPSTLPAFVPLEMETASVPVQQAVSNIEIGFGKQKTHGQLADLRSRRLRTFHPWSDPMTRIDSSWLATEPMDMRVGTVSQRSSGIRCGEALEMPQGYFRNRIPSVPQITIFCL